MPPFASEQATKDGVDIEPISSDVHWYDTDTESTMMGNVPPMKGDGN
jgi:hypothetical protein